MIWTYLIYQLIRRSAAHPPYAEARVTRKKMWKTAAPCIGSLGNEATMPLVLARLLQRELMHTGMLEGM